MHRSSTVYKPKQSKQICWWILVRGQQRIDLFSGGIVIMDYRLVFWPEVTSKMKLKCFNDGFIYKHSVWLHKMLTDGLEWCGLLVVYCDVFISCLDSHSDGTHSLQRIHWWTSDAKFLQICSDEETNSSTSWKAWEWVHIKHIFIFVWTIPLNTGSH